MPRRPALSALPLLSLLLGAAAGDDSSYFADWGVIGGRPQEPTCVDIPEDMPLCSGIDYSKMRLPNLLDHDTLKEAQQQSGYWVPLLNLQCHPNTQLFLCSLFTPVCLESPIPPCRSLCEAVRLGCESRMQTYSFPWPDMLKCDNFPLDNDMCITVQHTDAPGRERVQDDECQTCNPVETYENILDNYCRADLVIKAKVKRHRNNKLFLKKSKKVYKIRGADNDRRALRRLSFRLTEEAPCCSFSTPRKSYLIMARMQSSGYVPTFVMMLNKSKPLRQAMRTFRQGLNCSDPNLISNLEGTPLSPEGHDSPTDSRQRNSLRRCIPRCRKRCLRKCKKSRSSTCAGSCGKNCRGVCRRRGARGGQERGRRGRGGRNRQGGGHRLLGHGNRHELPEGMLPLGDLASEITNFAPPDIERPQPAQREN